MILYRRRRADAGRRAASTSAGASRASSRRAARSRRASSIATAGPSRTAEADILIGADGIHSAVRAHFYPDEGPPKWQGILMWRGVTVGKPFLGGATMVQAGHHNQKFVCYPDQPRPRRAGRGADQLDLRPPYGRGRDAAARGLEPPGQACRLPAALRGLEVRLARRAGRHPRGARHLRIPHGRPRSAAALVARPGHAPGRCRSSDVSHRLQRRLAGDPRRRGDHPGTSGRRRSGSGPAALRAAPPAADGAHRRKQSPQGHRRHARHRRAARAAGIFRRWKACCRPTSSRQIVADYKKLAAQDRETLLEPGGEHNKKPALFGDRPW